jgi:hypothetical protein
MCKRRVSLPSESFSVETSLLMLPAETPSAGGGFLETSGPPARARGDVRSLLPPVAWGWRRRVGTFNNSRAFHRTARTRIKSTTC